MREKINCLEGIRTIGCISVFLCHFRGAFLPDQAIWLIDHTPLMILTAGNSVVRILFVVSGFVISYKYFEIQRYEQVPKDMLKRYFRLAPSVIAANLFVYFLMKFGFMFHVQAAAVSGSEDFLGIFNNFTPNLVQCLKEALITCYFQGANGYIGPLWTMVYEYLGAILVLCVIYVCKGNYLRYLFYIVMFICFSSYYNYFVLGMLICDIYVQQDMNEILQRHRWISYGLFLPGGGISCACTKSMML